MNQEKINLDIIFNNIDLKDKEEYELAISRVTQSIYEFRKVYLAEDDEGIVLAQNIPFRGSRSHLVSIESMGNSSVSAKVHGVDIGDKDRLEINFDGKSLLLLKNGEVFDMGQGSEGGSQVASELASILDLASFISMSEDNSK